MRNDSNKPISKISREWFYFLNNKNIKREQPITVKITFTDAQIHKDKTAIPGEEAFDKYYNNDTVTFIGDGVDTKNKTIYEFNGDYFHGNPEKYGLTRIDLYNKTIEKRNILEANGWTVVSMRESDWIKIKNSMHPHVKNNI